MRVPAAPATLWRLQGEYVVDRDGLVWRVVRDGGMATRADFTGIESIGIETLRSTKGPLTSLNDFVRSARMGTTPLNGSPPSTTASAPTRRRHLMPRWDLVYKWADPETRSLVDAVTSALENCDHKLTAALATPPPVPAAPHPVLAKYGLESMAGDPLEVLDRHLSNNASASIGGWKAVAERWRKRALAAEAGAVPAAPGLDDPLDVNGPETN